MKAFAFPNGEHATKTDYVKNCKFLNVVGVVGFGVNVEVDRVSIFGGGGARMGAVHGAGAAGGDGAAERGDAGAAPD
jgi:hypothetical protein